MMEYNQHVLASQSRALCCKGLWGPKVDVITRSSGVKNNLVWQTGQEAGHPTYHVNENERIYGQEGYPT